MIRNNYKKKYPGGACTCASDCTCACGNVFGGEYASTCPSGMVIIDFICIDHLCDI